MCAKRRYRRRLPPEACSPFAGPDRSRTIMTMCSSSRSFRIRKASRIHKGRGQDVLPFWPSRYFHDGHGKLLPVTDPRFCEGVLLRPPAAPRHLLAVPAIPFRTNFGRNPAGLRGNSGQPRLGQWSAPLTGAVHDNGDRTHSTRRSAPGRSSGRRAREELSGGHRLSLLASGSHIGHRVDGWQHSKGVSKPGRGDARMAESCTGVHAKPSTGPISSPLTRA